MGYRYWSKGATNVGTDLEVMQGNGLVSFTGVENILLDMGWELHDGGFTTETYACYRSNGEDSNKMYGYVYVELKSNNLEIMASLDYDTSTHTCVNETYTCTIPLDATSNICWLWGDKDMVVLKAYTAMNYHTCTFGHVTYKWPHQQATAEIMADISAGAGVVVSVSNTTYFQVGGHYQIVGVNLEGQDWVTLSAVGTNTVTVASLSYDFKAGAHIGNIPLAFFCTRGTDYHLLNWVHYRGGASDTKTKNYCDMTADNIVDKTICSPDGRTLTYPLQRICFSDRHYGGGLAHFPFSIGIGNDRIMRAYTEYPYSENDVSYQTLYADGDVTSAGSGTLTDGTATWTTNQWATKLVVISAGLGSGQVREIASNTGTQLTVTEDWITQPDATSDYVICERAYRYTNIGADSYLACLEKTVDWSEPEVYEVHKSPYLETGSAIALVGTTVVDGAITDNIKWNYDAPDYKFSFTDAATSYVTAFTSDSYVQMSKLGGCYEFDLIQEGVGAVGLAGFIFGADSSLISDFANATYYVFTVELDTGEILPRLYTAVGGTTTKIAEGTDLSAYSMSGWKISRINNTFRLFIGGTLRWQHTDYAISPDDTRVFCGITNTVTGVTVNEALMFGITDLTISKYVYPSFVEMELTHTDIITGGVGSVADYTSLSGGTLDYVNGATVDLMCSSVGDSYGLFDDGHGADFGKYGGIVEFSLYKKLTEATQAKFIFGQRVEAFSSWALESGYVLVFNYGAPSTLILKKGVNEVWATTLATMTVTTYVTSHNADEKSLRVKLELLNSNHMKIYTGSNLDVLLADVVDHEFPFAPDSRSYFGFYVNLGGAGSYEAVSDLIPFKVYRRNW